VIPAISAEVLLAIRSGDTHRADRLLEQIAGLDPERLAAALSDDAARIATWLNLYNARSGVAAMVAAMPDASGS
jgi:hypothetical protein